MKKIGVFDSGVGGLTVLKVLAERFPHQSFVYLGDTARLPYGTKSIKTIAQYVEQNIAFLRSLNVGAVVIACHSASSAWLQSPSHEDIPIYEVITPSCHMAAQISHTRKVALMATKATVGGGAYLRTFTQIAPDIELIQQACPLLVPFVEEGLEDDPMTALIVNRYVGPHLHKSFDALILGCTHYPRLIQAFKKVCGRSVEFIDPAYAVADQMAIDLQSGRLKTGTDLQTLEIFCTDLSTSFIEVAQRCMSPLLIPTIQAVETATILNQKP